MRLLAVVAFSVLAVMSAARVADASPLSVFLASCSSNPGNCHGFAHDLIASAKNADYGCIPKSLSADDAGDQLLAWMRDTARNDPRYETVSLEDAMWAGVDELWPCRKE